VRWKERWRQKNIKCAVCEKYASCWVHQDCHVADEKKNNFEESSQSIKRKMNVGCD